MNSNLSAENSLSGKVELIFSSCFIFFFSSRRRHTRSLRDWSSDVCSSDLRRGRSGWRWRDGADTPLGEEREHYRVTIVPTGAAARTLAVDAPVARVTAAERAAGPVGVTVRSESVV